MDLVANRSPELEQADEAVAAGDLDAAETLLERVLERTQTGADARLARRRLRLLEERVRATRAGSASEALTRARGYARDGDHERARVWYEQAEQLAESPTERARALTGQASLLRRESRLADALRLAEQAVAADPNRRENMPAYANLIAILADLGRLGDAEAETERLLEAKPRNRIVNATAGRVYRELYEETGEPAHRAKADRCFREGRRRR